jgi:hypothetical protein
VTGNIRPVPDYVKRIINASIEHGEQVADFKVWPTSQPALMIERGERVALSLRIAPQKNTAPKLMVVMNKSDKVKCELKAQDTLYWLDVDIGPIDSAGYFDLPLTLISSDGSSDVPIKLAINVVNNDIIPSLASLDLGQESIRALKKGAVKTGRFGVRIQLGAFQIRAISSDLPFLAFEKQTLVEGSNYLVRVSVNAKAKLKQGIYGGVIRVETDNTRNAVIELPVRLTLVK